MNKSESITNLATALSVAQGQMPNATKDGANPMFRSRYATLASIWDACRDALSSNGLSVVQLVESSNPGTCTLTTILMHASGEWISSTMSIPVLPQIVAKGQDPAQTPQGYGSALTYARRYALAAIVGIAPDDDDGNMASTSSFVQNRTGRTVDTRTGEVLSPAPPKSSRREEMLKRIAKLGGNVEDAEQMNDTELIEYGKFLKAKLEEANPSTAPVIVDGADVNIVGEIEDKAYVSDKVCKFTLVGKDGTKYSITAFPKTVGVWALLVNGDGKFTAGGDTAEVAGHWSVKDGYDPSIIAHHLTFIDEPLFDND